MVTIMSIVTLIKALKRSGFNINHGSTLSRALLGNSQNMNPLYYGFQRAQFADAYRISSRKNPRKGTLLQTTRNGKISELGYMSCSYTWTCPNNYKVMKQTSSLCQQASMHEASMDSEVCTLPGLITMHYCTRYPNEEQTPAWHCSIRTL